MSINIKNREAEALLAELKRRTGRGATDLLLELLRHENARLEKASEAELDRARADTRALVDRWHARELVDPRMVEDILAYDEDGLPT